MEAILVVEKGYHVKNTTVATKTNTPVLEIPQSIQIINKDLFKDQGAYYLTDVLKNISGLSTNSEYNDIMFRGYRSQQAESFKQNGLTHFQGMFHKMRLTNVERIEVIKGPASVLYGELRPGGFINVITKQPRAERETDIVTVTGSWGKKQAHFSSTGPLPLPGKIGSLLYRVDVGHQIDGGFRKFEKFIYTYFTGALSWIMSDRTMWTFGGEFFDEMNKGQRARGTPYFNNEIVDLPAEYTANEPHDFINIKSYNYNTTFDATFSENLRFNAKAKYLYNERLQNYHEPRGIFEDPDTGRLMMQREFRDQYREKKHFISTADLIYDFNLGVDQKLLVGGSFEKTDGIYLRGTARQASRGGPVPDLDMLNPVYGTNENPLWYNYYGEDVPSGISSERQTTDNTNYHYTAYVQDQLAFGRFRAVLGLGFDHYRTTANDESGNEASESDITTRAGLVYKAKDNLSLYLNYGQGFEQVSTSVQFEPERYGGPFDPERSWTIEIGTKGTFFQDRLSVTTALYEIKKKNILYDFPTEELPDNLVQIGEFVSQGLEIDVSGQLSDAFSIFATYAYRIKAEAVEGTFENIEGLRPIELNGPNHPGHKYNIWARYNKDILDKRGLLGFSLGLSGMTERYTHYVGDMVPGYTILDGGIYFNYMHIGLTLNLVNITDKRYFTGAYGDRIGAWRGKPRSFETRLTYSF